MYAVVEIGGKQYRIEKGQSLLVDRLPEEVGARVSLKALLLRPDKGDPVFEGPKLGRVRVSAKVSEHLRGEKLRVFKHKPKRGYRHRAGHRSELTRIEIEEIEAGAAARSAATKPQKKRPARPKSGKQTKQTEDKGS